MTPKQIKLIAKSGIKILGIADACKDKDARIAELEETIKDLREYRKLDIESYQKCKEQLAKLQIENSRLRDFADNPELAQEVLNKDK